MSPYFKGSALFEEVILRNCRAFYWELLSFSEKFFKISKKSIARFSAKSYSRSCFGQELLGTLNHQEQ